MHVRPLIIVRVALAAALVRRSRPFLCAYLATRKKAAKVSLDGSCRCVCVEVLCRAVLERSPVLALIWTHATFNEAGGCVASVSGQRHVTGGDALQASTAVPFDEMAKRDIPVGIVEKHSFIDVFVLFFRRTGAASDRAPARSGKRAQPRAIRTSAKATPPANLELPVIKGGDDECVEASGRAAN